MKKCFVALRGNAQVVKISRMDIEENILKIIRGEKKAPLISAFLALLSFAYRAAVSTRNWAYDRGFLSSTRLSVPVISIGNIVAGGTGKTPLVHLLADHFQDKVRLAILTRGYRSQIEKSGRSELIGPQTSPDACGDEPYFLAQKTKAAVWVGVDRATSGRLAIEKGAGCLLLDDGMQHRRLKRDFEIAVIDGLDPFSQGRFLPWGLLRDNPKRLKAADLIVFTHVKDEKHYKQLQAQVARYSRAPTVGAQLKILASPLSRKVGVFCGIGKPERFLQAVRDLKSEIVDTLILKDHGSLREGELKHFADACREKGAEALLCTEKDHVKLIPDPSLTLKVEPLPMKWKIAFGKENWENLIENVLEKVK